MTKPHPWIAEAVRMYRQGASWAEMERALDVPRNTIRYNIVAEYRAEQQEANRLNMRLRRGK